MFDSYEDAKNIAEEKNQEMKNNIALNKQTLFDYEHEFVEQLSICQLFEKLALLKTEDMTITESINQENGLPLLKRL